MPTLEWNARTWGKEYQWDHGGDEWSAAWGSPDNQWRWTLQPRLRDFLPARKILEIGPGHGRWSQFLLEDCEDMVLVDISQSCIDVCKTRFASKRNIAYLVNDGTSLQGVKDASIDLVFSFDSLVHAELDVLSRYLDQLARKVSLHGVIFMHHSNLGAFSYFRYLRKIEALFKPPGSVFDAPKDVASASRKPGPEKRLTGWLSDILMRLRLTDRTHMRALSVSAKAFRHVAEARGFSCISQEIITWGRSRRPIDCISVLTPSGSKFDKGRLELINTDFMHEAGYVRKVAGMYDVSSRSSED